MVKAWLTGQSKWVIRVALLVGIVTMAGYYATSFQVTAWSYSLLTVSIVAFLAVIVLCSVRLLKPRPEKRSA